MSDTNGAGRTRFLWQGDMEDDCTCQVGDLLAHAECMGEIRWKDADERSLHTGTHWFVSVSRVGEDGRAIGPDLFHSGEHSGMISGAEMARAIAESILAEARPSRPRRKRRGTRHKRRGGILLS